MKHARKRKRRTPWLILPILLLAAAIAVWITKTEYGFARDVSPEEEEARLSVVAAAEEWLGYNEADGSHHSIIDLYNSQTELPRGYPVTYEDAWCSAFVTAVAIKTGNTARIPPECSCDEQIELFQENGTWEENDDYVPLPGDVIFYHWDCTALHCDHWTDHVGIVVGTRFGRILVIEGNKNNSVEYRVLSIGDPCIRGYGIPPYA